MKNTIQELWTIIMATDFVQHEPCPNCGSKDNLARYSDGHGWCFGCGHYEPGKYSPHLFEKLKNEDTTLKYPKDATNQIDSSAIKWLSQYGLTVKELIDNKVQWSPFMQMLLFPYLVDGVLAAWQGRNFGKGPKWFSRGKLHDLWYTVGIESPVVVFVEDIVSAIKVGRHAKSVPVFGSIISPWKLLKASRIADKIVIWLDEDKHKEALKAATKAQPFVSNPVIVIKTEADPKELQDATIKEVLK